jgi:hypothetical protein
VQTGCNSLVPSYSTPSCPAKASNRVMSFDIARHKAGPASAASSALRAPSASTDSRPESRSASGSGERSRAGPYGVEGYSWSNGSLVNSTIDATSKYKAVRTASVYRGRLLLMR